MVDDAGAGKDAEGLRSAYLPSEIEHVAVCASPSAMSPSACQEVQNESPD